MATETWSVEEVRIVIWAKHFPSRNLLPVDGGVCVFCDECSMSEFGAETWKMVELVGSALKNGCDRSTSGGTDFGKPTSHNSRFIRFIGGLCNIVHEEPWCC